MSPTLVGIDLNAVMIACSRVEPINLREGSDETIR